MRAGRAIRELASVRVLGNATSAVAERIRHREAAAIVERERAVKFPNLTAYNFRECHEWQERRLKELLS